MTFVIIFTLIPASHPYTYKSINCGLKLSRANREQTARHSYRKKTATKRLRRLAPETNEAVPWWIVRDQRFRKKNWGFKGASDEFSLFLCATTSAPSQSNSYLFKCVEVNGVSPACVKSTPLTLPLSFLIFLFSLSHTE